MDCTAELKAENYVFALYFSRFALSLPRYEKDTNYSYINIYLRIFFRTDNDAKSIRDIGFRTEQ